MKTHRISIGIFDKQTAQEIREQIKERNMVRGQKVASIFRGRGSRENGRGYHNDLRIQDAEKVSVYLDVVTKDDEFVLPYLLKERISFRLAEKMMENGSAKGLLTHGTKGFMNYEDEQLVRLMLDYI